MPAPVERGSSIPTRTVTDADQRAAALVCAANADGPQDLSLLLDALGLAATVARPTTSPIVPNRTDTPNTVAARRPNPEGTPMATSPNAYTAVALSMRNDGRTAEEIAAGIRIPLDEVHQMLTANPPAGDLVATVTPPTPAVDLTDLDHVTVPVELIEDVTADRVLNELIAWGQAHADTAVRQHAGAIRVGITALRERRATDDELHAAQSQIQHLEEQLQALRGRVAELQPEQSAPQRKPKPKRERDYDPKTVRAWATANGHDVAPAGIVPGHVVDAWRKATGHGLAA
ncbi:histone-like nucleoid-structuring protein Lsr2 [Kitasatospora sp. NPDC059811]|uniref:Lsr2 family DNA-binding protein n=1 Tax=Streptomycetaceae TaxID=2062 RepID=UPI0007AFA4A9|nr:histone-like nucleoid-structuring protein Lsr2 [Streptomyces sp. MJM8645]